MNQSQLDQIKARAAEPDKVLEWAGNPYADEYTSALQATAADVVPLVAEVERLRKALAGHLFDRESPSVREEIRSEMMADAVRAHLALDMVRETIKDLDYHHEREGNQPDFLARANSWVDVRDRLQEILARAEPEDLGETLRKS
jgi:hypothetical protein